MPELVLQTPNRICAATGRALRPGDRYFGVVAFDGQRLTRRDFSPEAWAGPPDGAMGHWAGRVPDDADARRRPMIDDQMLVECFQRTEGDLEPARQQFRYIIALLLVRRRRFKLDDAAKSNGALALRDVRTGERLTVADPGLTDEQLVALESDVFQMLGWQDS